MNYELEWKAIPFFNNIILNILDLKKLLARFIRNVVFFYKRVYLNVTSKQWQNNATVFTHKVSVENY